MGQFAHPTTGRAGLFPRRPRASIAADQIDPAEATADGAASSVSLQVAPSTLTALVSARVSFRSMRKNGMTATFDQAKTEFKANWDRWLAWAKLSHTE
jgi:hypothetical protein